MSQAVLKKSTADNIKSQLTSGAKTYATRDANSRITHFYEAPHSAKVDDACLLTEFKYVDGPAGTSRNVLATKESVVAWEAGFDFDGLP